MLFQVLDYKKECVGLFIDSKIQKNYNIDELSRTWSYSPILKNKNIEFANLYCENKSISEVCPEEFKLEFNYYSDKIKSFIKSFDQAKISLNDNCIYDLIPYSFLIKFYEVRNKITQYILQNYKKPEEYEFLKRFNELLIDISLQDINLNFDNIKSKIYDNKTHEFYKKAITFNNKINYNMFATITGRLGVEKNSFPILTLPKQYRTIVKPKNDYFVSFDMNAAELRTSLALIEKDLPDFDLHQKITDEIFNNSISRTEAKQCVTSWLYNSANPVAQKFNDKLDDLFEKENLINSYWDGKYIHTPFSRKIESDKFNAISRLNQSTFIDLFHRQVIKVDDYLKNNNSFISFLLHDEFVIDLDKNEKEKIIDIIKILENTELGKYIVNVKIGKSFGDMKKISLKV